MLTPKQEGRRTLMGTPWKSEVRREALQDAAITLDEIRAKRESLQIGDRIKLEVDVYDQSGTYIGKKMVDCRLVHKSRHVAVFARDKGLPIHLTYVELVMMDRERSRHE